jgi:hypothetical protein
VIGTRKLKALEQENARLKRAVANLTLDNPSPCSGHRLILKEAAEGNFPSASSVRR